MVEHCSQAPLATSLRLPTLTPLEATMLNAKTPCCNARVKTTGLNAVGDSASRKCRVCGACYVVTVAPARMVNLGGALRLEYRLTRRAKD